MLRRTQTIASQNEGQPTNDAPRFEVPPAAPFVERRRNDRRGMDTLRAEALNNLISRVEDRNFGGLRNRSWGRGFKPSRLALLAVAIVAGGLAAWLATQRDSAVAPAVAEPEQQIVQEARTQILVARDAIGVGERVTASSFVWEEWPEGAVRPEYITISTAPEAPDEIAGRTARSDFVPGEPIRQEKLTDANGQSQLSAVLEAGMRAVSVAVSAESASGGFIAPGDHVDVVLTRETETAKFSDTILNGAQVLAINSRLTDTPPPEGEEEGPAMFTDQAIATLALDPTQAETIMTALTMGRLSLVLRPASDVAAAGDSAAGDAAGISANQAIRISSPFWTK